MCYNVHEIRVFNENGVNKLNIDDFMSVLIETLIYFGHLPEYDWA